MSSTILGDIAVRQCRFLCDALDHTRSETGDMGIKDLRIIVWYLCSTLRAYLAQGEEGFPELDDASIAGVYECIDLAVLQVSRIWDIPEANRDRYPNIMRDALTTIDERIESAHIVLTCARRAYDATALVHRRIALQVWQIAPMEVESSRLELSF
ncbi:hypothetical protein RQP46_005170 [Phenoliferia psychrophenolica]